MMGVGEGDRKRVGGIVGGEHGLGHEHRHHQPDLLLLRVPGSDDGLLDGVRGVFGDRQPGPGGDQQRHPAGLPELQRGARVLVDEGLLDRRLVRLEFLEDPVEPVVDVDQPAREVVRTVRRDGARGDEADRVAEGVDHPQPVRRRPGSIPRMRTGVFMTVSSTRLFSIRT